MKKTINIKLKQVQAFLGEDADMDEIKDYVGTYEIKSWNFGERERIITRFANQKIDADGETVTEIAKDEPFRIAVMEKCIRNTPMKSAPTQDFLDGLPIWLGEALWKVVNDLNEKSLTGKESKKFEFN